MTLIGQFGVGFYSAFMVADHVDVISRRAGADEAWRWSSDGKGTFTVTPVDESEAPPRGTRVMLHLTEEAKGYTDRFKLEQMVKEQSGHVPVPIALVEKPGAAPTEIADGAALWTKPRGEISTSEYADFYRSVAGHFDEPALTVHFRAEGRQEFTALLFVPQTRPFDLFETGSQKRPIKLYVKRVFITDDVDLLPRYLQFVRGVVDFGGSSAQYLARNDSGKRDPGRDQEECHRPYPERAREARRERRGGLRKDLGGLRSDLQGRASTMPTTAATPFSGSPASRPRRDRCEASRTMSAP